MSEFKQVALAELTDQQVRFAPPSKRMAQLARAEELLAEIDPDKEYPYQFVCWRITDYRPDAHRDLLVAGEDLTHDLYSFIAELAHSMPAVPADKMDEPVLTLDQISRKLNVSQKTINRWRT